MVFIYILLLEIYLKIFNEATMIVEKTTYTNRECLKEDKAFLVEHFVDYLSYNKIKCNIKDIIINTLYVGKVIMKVTHEFYLYISYNTKTKKFGNYKNLEYNEKFHLLHCFLSPEIKTEMSSFARYHNFYGMQPEHYNLFDEDLIGEPIITKDMSIVSTDDCIMLRHFHLQHFVNL
jgi:hypothetical protein